MPDALLDVQLPHGRCVLLRFPAEPGAAELGALHPAEAARALALPPARRASWVGGRLALRAALGREAPAILADDRGAPLLPPDVTGSITHKRDVAGALVAPFGGARVGVDLELDAPLRVDISRRVLTAAEIAALGPERDRGVLVRLSLKEALYKALDPFVRRYVGFKEAEVVPHADGTATFALSVAEGPFAAEGSWQIHDGLILTTARVRPGGPSHI